jgi:transposase-like protein
LKRNGIKLENVARDHDLMGASTKRLWVRVEASSTSHGVHDRKS